LGSAAKTLSVSYRRQLRRGEKWPKVLTKENVVVVDEESEGLCFASSSRKITVSSKRVATALLGWEAELAMPNGILFIEK